MKNGFDAEDSVDRLAKLLVIITVALLPLAILPVRAMFSLPKAMYFTEAGLAAGGIVLYRWFALGRPVRKARLGYLVLSFALLALISAAVSPYGRLFFLGRYNSFEGLVILLEYALAYFFAVQFSWRDQDIRQLSLAAVAAASMAALFGTSQAFGLSPWRTEQAFDYYRAASTLGNPIYLGVYLVTVWPLAIGLATAGRKSDKIVGYLGASIILAGLALTVSRGAWLAWMVTALILVVYDRRVRVAAAALGGALAVALLAAAVLSPNFLGGKDLKTRAVSTASAESRLQIWRGALSIIKDRPLTGVGPDSFAWAYPTYQVAEENNNGERIADAHSYPLQLAATLGLPAAAIFLLIMGGAVSAALKTGGRGRPGRELYLGAGLVGYFIAMGTGVSTIASTGIVWFFIGVIDSRGAVETRPGRIGRLATGVAFSVVAVIMTGAALAYGASLKADNDYRTARLSQAVGDLAGADRRFLAAARIGPGDGPYKRDAALFYLGKARARRSKGDLVRGLRLAEAAVRRNPYESDNYDVLSKLYIVAGKAVNPAYQRRAEKASLTALKFNPGSALANYNLGETYLIGGRNRPAAKHLAASAAISPSPEAYYGLGRAYENLGLRSKARAAYRRALRFRPGWPQAEDKLRALGG